MIRYMEHEILLSLQQFFFFLNISNYRGIDLSPVSPWWEYDLRLEVLEKKNNRTL